MKVIAVIEADLDVTPLGTRSRLGCELGGVTILRRTVERVRRATLIDAVHVLCPVAQYEKCAALLDGTGAKLHRLDADPPPWRALVQASRKWSLDGWRGGVGGATWFDEYVSAPTIAGLLQITDADADAVLGVSPAAPFFDPALADRMIEHHKRTGRDVRLAFTQAPPGIAGILLDASLVRELVDKNIPIGWLFSYKPDTPQKDLIFEDCCCEVPVSVRHASGRLIADTDRAFERIADLFAAEPDPDLETTGRWLIERDATHVESVPREVEIELTTDDPYPDALLRPRGARLGRTGAIDPGVVERIVECVSRYDDALIMLGGFGDPLRHPRFADVLRAVRGTTASGDDDGRRSRGAYGLAVRSCGVDLSEAAIDAMIEYGVDVFSLTLDAWSPDLYRELQTPGAAAIDSPAAASLESVLAKLDLFTDARKRRGRVTPLLVPELTKALENVQELDDFFDGWIRRTGAVGVHGYNHYARGLVDRSVTPMAPAARTACRRIKTRCLVLADGSVTMCDQDYAGAHILGNVRDQSLAEIWQGADLARIRAAHESGAFNATPMCANCEEWHRP